MANNQMEISWFAKSLLHGFFNYFSVQMSAISWVLGYLLFIHNFFAWLPASHPTFSKRFLPRLNPDSFNRWWQGHHNHDTGVLIYPTFKTYYLFCHENKWILKRSVQWLYFVFKVHLLWKLKTKLRKLTY